MLGAEILMIAVIFIMFFAQNITMLLIGDLLCGLPWGAFQTLTTTYAAEISPMPLRPYLTTYCNMCVSGEYRCVDWDKSLTDILALVGNSSDALRRCAHWPPQPNR